MTRDFTYRAYADLLDAAVAAGFEFLTVREFLSMDPLPPRFLVLRHDVVRKPANALDFARIESEHDVSGTYYLRTGDRTFEPATVRAIELMGHEVGYCYEDLDRAEGDDGLAAHLFRTNLSRLRRHASVDTACPYANPLTPYDNRSMWDDPDDLARYDLLGDPDRAVAAADVPQFSDAAGGIWYERPAGGAGTGDGTRTTLDAESTADLVDLFRRHRVSRAWLRVHPNRWADSYPEFVATRTRDAAVEAARRGLELLP